MRYVGGAGIRVLGPVTRREYLFSDRHLIQRVASADAAVMLRTRLFRPTW